MAVDVGRGVVIGVAHLLRLFERRVKRHAIMNHLAEDIVCRAVEDAADLLDLVRSQALHHRADKRDAAANRSFKQVIDIVLLGQCQQLFAVGCDQLLVGGAHALARLEAALGKLIGRADAAHDLGDHANLRVVLDDRKVGHELVRIGQVREITQVEYILDLDLFADCAGDL